MRVVRLSLAIAAGVALTLAGATAPAAAGTPTTAWLHGRFVVDPAGVVSRSNVVLDKPNTDTTAAMPLGNGRLGAAVWAADGMSVQLNRSDTLPDRLSPGQLVLPGLAALTSAPDYHGSLDLYHGRFTESGGGITATVFVHSDSDQLEVDVLGVDPDTPQTARLQLWAPRSPTAFADGPVAGLSQTWQDDTQPGATGQTFGSLAAISAVGRDVHTAVLDPRTVQLTVTPDRDGSYRVLTAAPSWHGGNAVATARAVLPGIVGDTATSLWWQRFWRSIGLFRMSSPDGVAQYIENLRTIDLYAANADSGSTYPGSQAGVGDLFSAQGDFHNWDPGAYWHWNLRMQVAADLGAGAPQLNAPYFRLYRDNLTDIENWTQQHMAGRPGICVPETMRFNGVGYEYETWLDTPGLDCDASVAPTWNGRTLSTGAEVALWVWQQYEQTGDRNFLAQNYPLLAQATRFLLAYAEIGADGTLHTDPSNAHETQWDVDNPTTDIAAEQALFPVLIEAAGLLHTDAALAARTRAALRTVAGLPRTDIATRTQLLFPADDASGQDMIGPSDDPAAPAHNTENIGLEPVWPYGLIGDSGSLTALAQRTFTHRTNVEVNDWSNDPIQAARLGRAPDVASTLVGLTEQFQAYPNGFAEFGPREPYVEQIGVLADAVQESLVQDYDGLLRIAPAWPGAWDVDGTVAIQHRSSVSVQIRGGQLVTAVVTAGEDTALRVRNPWLGQRVEVVDGAGRVVLGPTGAAQFTLPVRAGGGYLIERVAAPTTALPFAPVTGTPATSPKTLGDRMIGS
ncbi:MAG TPA: hypothetical protein VG756_20855 [Pseudonocardiaceae bacterium]|nr:hypothetical protein [Pseudonocardiaceae bacterium]